MKLMKTCAFIGALILIIAPDLCLANQQAKPAYLRKLEAKLTTQAGDWSSGGGVGVVCFANSNHARNYQGIITEEHLASGVIVSITQYDLYVSLIREKSLPQSLDGLFTKTRSGNRKLIRPDKTETVRQFSKRIIDRLGGVLPDFSQYLLEAGDEFEVTPEPGGMELIPDFDPMGLIDMEKCVYAQLARQRTVGKKNYLSLDLRLFDHPAHSVFSQSTLMLHEFVYLRGRSLYYDGVHHKTSVATRNLVHLMLTQEVNSKEFLSVAKLFGYEKNALGISTLTDEIIEDLLKFSAQVVRKGGDELDQLIRPIISNIHSSVFHTASMTKQSSGLDLFYRAREAFGKIKELVLYAGIDVNTRQTILTTYEGQMNNHPERRVRRTAKSQIPSAQVDLTKAKEIEAEAQALEAQWSQMMQKAESLYSETIERNMVTAVNQRFENHWVPKIEAYPGLTSNGKNLMAKIPNLSLSILRAIALRERKRSSFDFSQRTLETIQSFDRNKNIWYLEEQQLEFDQLIEALMPELFLAL